MERLRGHCYRAENETLETPKSWHGQIALDVGYRFDEINRVVVVLFDTGRNREIFGSKMISSGGKPTSSTKIR